MTLFKYAIARRFTQVLEESNARTFDAREMRGLQFLEKNVQRFEAEEQEK